MSKLIKAEWYRFTHSGIMFKVFIFMTFFSFLMHYINDPRFLEHTLCENMVSYSSVIGLVLCMFLGTLIAATLGMLYHNRTGNYEIMDGNTPSQIILSKLIVYISSCMVAVFLPMGIISVIVGMKNGIGEGLNLPLFYSMIFVKVLHIASVAVLSTLILKSLLGAAIPYIRFLIFEIMGFEMITMAFPSNTTIREIAQFFPAYQVNYSLIQLTGDCGELVLKFILSFVVEIPLLYIVTYVGYKKKWFVK